MPDLERLIAQEENAISILLGDYPHAVPRGRPLVEQHLPPEVPPSLPSTLIERRPDIREAEQSLVAANAQVGVAKAEFFPQISLTGSGGGAFGRSSAFSSLMSTQLGIWAYGLQVTQPLFTGGALTGNLRFAKSQNQQAVLSYRQAIQRALGMSDALIGYQIHDVRVRQEVTVADLRSPFACQTCAKRGTTTYLEVLDGRRSLFSPTHPAQAAAPNTESALYRSLGEAGSNLGTGATCAKR